MNSKKSVRPSLGGCSCPSCVLWVAILLCISMFIIQSSAFAQPELPKPQEASEAPENHPNPAEKKDTLQQIIPDLRLYITSEVNTSFDSTHAPPGTEPFEKKFYEQYFDSARTETLQCMVSRTMERILNAGLEDFDLNVEITTNPDSALKFEAYPNSHIIQNTFWPTTDGNFYVGSKVLEARTDELVFLSSYQKLSSGNWLRKQDRSVFDLDSGYSILDQEVNRILRELASTLVSRIDTEIIQWLVESSIKLRVEVSPFDRLGGDSTWRHFEKGLKAMIETELSRSEAIMIYADEYQPPQPKDSTARQDKEPPVRPNYRVHGSFFPVGNGLRVDLRCIKVRANRILTSNKVTADTLSVDHLSSRIAEASNRLKSAMLSDFRQSSKTIAIVAEPPIRYFSAEEMSKETRDIAKLIVYNMTNKLQRLMAHSEKLDTTVNMKVYYYNSKIIDHYIKDFTNPADIIHDLDIDYLALVRTEDLGHRIRLSTNFHSYDLERPALAEYIWQDDKDKSRVKSIIDTTVLHMSKKLCEKKILKAPNFCKLARQDNPDSLQKILKRVRMIDFRRNKKVGIRAGPTMHFDPEIYLGKESTEYFEAFFSLRVSDWGPWWLSHELEASVGYDLGAGNIYRKGVISANGLLTWKLVISKWEYESFPIVLSCGAGGGIIGISYRYDKGDQPYEGQCAYKHGISGPAGNAMAGIELPISDRLRLQGVIRLIFPTRKIESFANVPFDESVAEPPVGSLNSLLFIGGIEYIWR